MDNRLFLVAKNRLVAISVTKSMLTQEACGDMQTLYRKELDISVISIILHHSLTQVISGHTKSQCMKESHILVINVITKQQGREI